MSDPTVVSLMMRFLFYPADADPSDAQWLMRCLILHGASEVNAVIDGKEVKGIRFRFRPGQPMHYVDYQRPARPYLLITRGAS